MLAKRVKQVLVMAGVVAGGVAVWRGVQRWRLRQLEQASDPAAQATGLASMVGVSPVDPQPMTQIAGEGIDLDAVPAPSRRLDDVIGEPARAMSYPKPD